MRAIRLLAAVTLLLCAATAQHITITNPSELPGARWAHDLAIPKSKRAEPVPLEGKDRLGRRWVFRRTGQTGTHWIYKGFGAWDAGQAQVRVELHDDTSGDSWVDQPFQLHPQIKYAPWEEGETPSYGMDDLNGHVVVYAKGVKIADVKLTLGPQPLVATPQAILWNGWQYVRPFRFDYWLEFSSADPAPRLWFLVTVDAWDPDRPWSEQSNTFNVDSITLSFGHEIAFPYTIAHGVRLDYSGERGSATWTIPGGRLSRCTAPISLFSAHLICRGGLQGKIDEDQLTAYRFGPCRAMLTRDELDEHVPPFGPAPKFSSTCESLIQDHRDYLFRSGSWTSKRRFGSDQYPNSGGDKYPFGVVQAPELYSASNARLLDWFVESAIGDAGNRNVHHVTHDEGRVWKFSADSETYTWSDRPHFAQTKDPIWQLGPQLPGRTVHGWGNYDGQHNPDTLPAVYRLTGDPVVHRMLYSRAQMQAAVNRRYVPWVGVGRETGRRLAWAVRACSALGDPNFEDLMADSMLEVVRRVTEQWRGKTRPDDAWLREIYPDQYEQGNGKSEVSPWQNGLAVNGLAAAWLRWGERWRQTDPDVVDELERMTLLVARTVVRLGTVNRTTIPGPGAEVPVAYYGWGTPYYCYGSDSSDPAVIHDPRGPSWGALYALWTAGAVEWFVHRSGLPVSDPDMQHAMTILAGLPEMTSPGDARWLGVR